MLSASLNKTFLSLSLVSLSRSVFRAGVSLNNQSMVGQSTFLSQGFVMVYDVTNFESFKRLDKLKKDIDRHHDKRDVSNKECSQLK